MVETSSLKEYATFQPVRMPITGVSTSSLEVMIRIFIPLKLYQRAWKFGRLWGAPGLRQKIDFIQVSRIEHSPAQVHRFSIVLKGMYGRVSWDGPFQTVVSRINPGMETMPQ